jgi:hypothetical protein
MATKKITGQSKLAQTAESKIESKERLDLVPSRKRPSLKVYRLYDDDIAKLKEITAIMNCCQSPTHQ